MVLLLCVILNSCFPASTALAVPDILEKKEKKREEKKRNEGAKGNREGIHCRKMRDQKGIRLQP